jgi:2-methylisocitrate lyase-like PEP mutase family enzyme
MTTFADLHRPGEPLLLPNAWDHASAAALAAEGFAAVGTTSLGVAAALGLRDGAAETAEATIDLAHRLTHLPTPITIDIEDGFSKDPAAVADYVERLGPVAGVNLEDQLGDPATHAAVVAAVKARTPEVFVNARTDTYWLGRPSLDETLERARTYVAAGADGIFVPGVTDEDEIAALAEALPVPLNVLFAPGKHPVARLAELGVARISTGSLLYRVALGAAIAAATGLRDGASEFKAPTYAAVDALAEPKGS